MAIRFGSITAGWMRDIVRNIGAIARANSKGKSGAKQGQPVITVSSGRFRALVSASRFHAGRPALDGEIKVPVGGFPPPPGRKAWRMIKPEGVVYRSRTYSRFSGQIIRKRGFLSEAIRRVLGMQIDTIPKGIPRITPVASVTAQLNLQRLAFAIALKLANEIATDIVLRVNASPNMKATKISSSALT